METRQEEDQRPPRQNPNSRSYADVLKGKAIANHSSQDAATSDLQILPKSFRHRGHLAIAFSTDEVNLLSSDLRFLLVGKFPHRRPSMKYLRTALESIGFAGFQIGLLNPTHIVLRLNSEEDYYRLWVKRSWSFGGCLMKILKWTPDFNPYSEPPIVPIWVGFPELPLHLFKQEALFPIARLIGNPLRLDAATKTLSRPSIARICIDIDVSKSLPSNIWIQSGDLGFLQEVVYERVPDYCMKCFRLGHDSLSCGNFELGSKKLKSKWIEKANDSHKEAGPSDSANQANVSVDRTIQVPGKQISDFTNIAITDFDNTTALKDKLQHHETSEIIRKDHNNSISSSEVKRDESLEDRGTNEEVSDVYDESMLVRKGKKIIVDSDGFITPHPRKTRKYRGNVNSERTIITRSLAAKVIEVEVPPQPAPSEQLPDPSQSSECSDSDSSSSEDNNDPALKDAYQFEESLKFPEELDSWIVAHDTASFRSYQNGELTAEAYLDIRKRMFIKMAEEFEKNPNFDFKNITWK